MKKVFILTKLFIALLIVALVGCKQVETTTTNNNASEPPAKEVTESDIRSKDVAGGVGITEYKGKSTSIEIPSDIDGKSVVGIEDNAFKDKDIVDVIIPNTIATIGESAFEGNDLSTLTLPDSLTQIEQNAFAGNPRLSRVSINATVPPTLASNALSATYLFVPAGSVAAYQAQPQWVNAFSIIVAIGTDVTAISLPDFTTTDVTGGVEITSYNGSKTSLVIPDVLAGKSVISLAKDVFKDKSLTNVVLPQDLSTIGESAFEGNDLTSLNLPSSVTTIGDSAFAGNVNLAHVSVANAVPFSIGKDVFKGNANPNFLFVPTGSVDDYKADNDWLSLFNLIVAQGTDTSGLVPSEFLRVNTTAGIEIVGYTGSDTDIVIPSTIDSQSVVSIGNAALMAKGLTSVSLPDSLINIEARAFHDNQLATLTLPSKLVSIGNSAFESNSFSTLVIPDSVTHIGSTAFSNIGITNLTLGKGLTTLERCVFQFNDLVSVIIPDNITSIGYATFNGNIDLTSLTLGSGVTSISQDAFSQTGLTSVTIKTSTPPAINYHSFTYLKGPIANLYVPSGSLADYNADTDWSAAFTAVSVTP